MTEDNKSLLEGLPRRVRTDKYSPAETAIRAAMLEVENAGVHPLLTEATHLLSLAQARVADFVDKDDPTQAEFIGYPKMMAFAPDTKDLSEVQYFDKFLTPSSDADG